MFSYSQLDHACIPLKFMKCFCFILWDTSGNCAKGTSQHFRRVPKRSWYVEETVRLKDLFPTIWYLLGDSKLFSRLFFIGEKFIFYFSEDHQISGWYLSVPERNRNPKQKRFKCSRSWKEKDKYWPWIPSSYCLILNSFCLFTTFCKTYLSCTDQP